MNKKAKVPNVLKSLCIFAFWKIAAVIFAADKFERLCSSMIGKKS